MSFVNPLKSRTFHSEYCCASAAPLLCFRNKFEVTLEALSQFETREAQVLMTEALEAMDMMNNAIVLQNEVLTTYDVLCVLM